MQHGNELQLRQEPTRTLPLAILHTHTHSPLISPRRREKETLCKSLGRRTRKGMNADLVPLSDAVRMAEVSSARIHRPGSNASGSSQ